MPQPSVNSVHIDAILTNISIAYLQDQTNFIADKVFPTVPVEKQSNLYFKYKKNDWFRDEAQRRADATESAGSGYNLATDSYSAQVYAFHKDVGDQTMANADAPLNPEMEAATFVVSRLALRREIDFVSKYFTTGVWGTDITGVASAPTGGQTIKWTDYVNSDPLTDIETGKEGILSVTGYEANTLVLGYKAFRYLKNHTKIVDRYKYTTAHVITQELLAELFGVERVLVAKAVKATNGEGATDAYAFAFGSNALLCYSAPSPGLLAPSAGYTFAWTGVSQGMGGIVGTKNFRMEQLGANRIESEIAFDNKVVATDLGYFFSAIV